MTPEFLDTYQKDAMRTASSLRDVFRERSLGKLALPDDIIEHLRLSNGALGLVDEAIEAYELLDSPTGCLGRLPDELGDCWWYVAHITTTMQVPLSNVVDFRKASTMPKVRLTESMKDLLFASKELGEVIKKYSYHGHAYSIASLTARLYDVTDALVAISNTIGVSVPTVLWNNIDKLAKRYPDAKFETVRSEKRDEK